MSQADQLRRKEIAIIHLGCSHLQIDEDSRRDMIARLCSGKRSTAELTWQERKKVIEHLKASGFAVKPKAGRASLGRNEEMMSKLRKMWHLLIEASAVEAKATTAEVDEAIESWAQRMLKKPGGVTSLRFATPHDMARLIEAMKKWCKRLDINLSEVGR